jgi:CheY-like chemotaxis protein
MTCTHIGTILVIDDDPLVRGLVRDILEPFGYDLIEAADGRRALDICRTSAVALVIVDLVMPEREGIETIRDLRSEFPELPVIAMSGAFGGLLKIAKALGASSTLPKPFTATDIIHAVQDQLAAA